MRKIGVLLVLIFFVSGHIFSQSKYIELNELLDSEQVSVAARGKGGYFGEVLMLRLRNIHNRPLFVKISAGTVFESEDERIQDLMVLNNYQFVIQKGATKITHVSATCIQSSNGSPYKNAKYQLDRLDQEGLYNVAQSIAINKAFDDYFSASAVWCVSNPSTHPIEHLSSTSSSIFIPITKAVCKARGKDFSAIKFSKKHIPSYRINSFFKTFLDKDQKVSIDLYHEGTKIETIAKVEAKKGFFYHPFMFSHREEETTSFVVKLTSNDGVLLEKEVGKDSPAHFEGMTLVETKNRITFVLDEPEKITLAIYDDKGRLYHTYYQDREYAKSAQTTINMENNAFIPKKGKYFMIAKDEQGKELGRDEVYTDGFQHKKQDMIVQRYSFAVNLVDPVNGVSLDVYDKYGNKVFNAFENSRLHHGYRVLPIAFKHYLGHGQIFYYKLTDANGFVIQEHEAKGK